MRVADFKGKTVVLYYTENEGNLDVENPTVEVIEEVEGYGLYVDIDGRKEVVPYTVLSGWRVLD